MRGTSRQQNPWRQLLTPRMRRDRQQQTAQALQPASAPTANEQVATEGAVPTSALVMRAPEPIACRRRKKRKSFFDHSAIDWTQISVTSAEVTATPVAQCVFCGKMATWPASRNKDNVFRINASKPCTSDSRELLDLKEKLPEKRKVATGRRIRRKVTRRRSAETRKKWSIMSGHLREELCGYSSSTACRPCRSITKMRL